MTKRNNKYIKFLTYYFITLGASIFTFTLITAVFHISSIGFVSTVRAFTVGLIPTAVMNTFFWNKNDDAVELWIKRIYYCIISVGSMALCIFMFNDKSSLKIFGLCFGVGLASALLMGIPIWIISDRRQKRTLEQINKKLNEMQNNENH